MHIATCPPAGFRPHFEERPIALKQLAFGNVIRISKRPLFRCHSQQFYSDRPLDNSEGASGEALLQIDIAEDLLTAFEWVEEGTPYREWLVPAAVLNDAGTVRLLDESAD